MFLLKGVCSLSPHHDWDIPGPPQEGLPQVTWKCGCPPAPRSGHPCTLHIGSCLGGEAVGWPPPPQACLRGHIPASVPGALA